VIRGRLAGRFVALTCGAAQNDHVDAYRYRSGRYKRRFEGPRRGSTLRADTARVVEQMPVPWAGGLGDDGVGVLRGGPGSDFITTAWVVDECYGDASSTESGRPSASSTTSSMTRRYGKACASILRHSLPLQSFRASSRSCRVAFSVESMVG
jgi:hypothetical protein